MGGALQPSPSPSALISVTGANGEHKTYLRATFTTWLIPLHGVISRCHISSPSACLNAFPALSAELGAVVLLCPSPWDVPGGVGSWWDHRPGAAWGHAGCHRVLAAFPKGFCPRALCWGAPTRSPAQGRQVPAISRNNEHSLCSNSGFRADIFQGFRLFVQSK